jgi:anti-sigma B factor antagonist
MNEPTMSDDDQSRSQPAFAVEQSPIAGAVLLSVRGDVDALTAPRLTEAIFGAVPEPPSPVIIDLSDVDFLASAGMTVLVTANERIAKLFVVADGPGTSRPLTLLGLDRVLALYPTLDEALSALSS